jgi:hypothetical protein
MPFIKGQLQRLAPKVPGEHMVDKYQVWLDHDIKDGFVLTYSKPDEKTCESKTQSYLAGPRDSPGCGRDEGRLDGRGDGRERAQPDGDDYDNRAVSDFFFPA